MQDTQKIKEEKKKLQNPPKPYGYQRFLLVELFVSPPHPLKGVLCVGRTGSLQNTATFFPLSFIAIPSLSLFKIFFFFFFFFG